MEEVKKIKGYFLYRFLGYNNKVLYIGKTTDLKQRMLTHRWVTSKEWHGNIRKIEYCQLQSEYDMNIQEVHNICKYSPIYNKQFNSKDDDLYGLPDVDWVEYDAREFWKERRFSIDILLDLIEEYRQSDEKRKVTKGELLAKDEKLHKLRDKARAELWSHPYIQQLIDDGIISISGRNIEFLEV